MDTIKTDLAATLNIDPDQIKQYARRGSTYNVILTDYRKLTGVIRTVVTESAPAATTSAVELAPGERDIYEHPEKYKRAALRILAHKLGLPGAASMNKAPLIQAITRHREAH